MKKSLLSLLGLAAILVLVPACGCRKPCEIKKPCPPKRYCKKICCPIREADRVVVEKEVYEEEM